MRSVIHYLGVLDVGGSQHWGFQKLGVPEVEVSRSWGLQKLGVPEVGGHMSVSESYADRGP